MNWNLELLKLKKGFHFDQSKIFEIITYAGNLTHSQKGANLVNTLLQSLQGRSELHPSQLQEAHKGHFPFSCLWDVLLKKGEFCFVFQMIRCDLYRLRFTMLFLRYSFHVVAIRKIKIIFTMT